MQRVIVLDSNEKELAPCHPARARELLKKGRARVYSSNPYTIILINQPTESVSDVDVSQGKGGAASSAC